MAIIYRIRHVASGASYVGSTIRRKQRFATHFKELVAAKHTCVALQALWNDQGPEAFEWETLETCDDAARYDREQWWMDNSNSDLNTYKFATSSHHPEVRARISASRAGKGHPISESAKAAIAESNKKAYASLSEEERRKRASKPETFSETMVRVMTGKPQKNPNSPARAAARAKGMAATPANKPGWIPTHRIGVKDTPETIEQRRASRFATEAARRAQGVLYVWINDGTRGQKIVAGAPIPDGWMLGRQLAYVEKARLRKGETRDAIARENMRKAQLASNEARIAAGTPHHNTGVQQNYCWITDGIENKRQLKAEPIQAGWRRGRVITRR